MLLFVAIFLSFAHQTLSLNRCANQTAVEDNFIVDFMSTACQIKKTLYQSEAPAATFATHFNSPGIASAPAHKYIKIKIALYVALWFCRLLTLIILVIFATLTETISVNRKHIIIIFYSHNENFVFRIFFVRHGNSWKRENLSENCSFREDLLIVRLFVNDKISLEKWFFASC